MAQKHITAFFLWLLNSLRQDRSKGLWDTEHRAKTRKEAARAVAFFIHKRKNSAKISTQNRRCGINGGVSSSDQQDEEDKPDERI